jgi:hypothetical protein
LPRYAIFHTHIICHWTDENCLQLYVGLGTSTVLLALAFLLVLPLPIYFTSSVSSPSRIAHNANNTGTEAAPHEVVDVDLPTTGLLQLAWLLGRNPAVGARIVAAVEARGTEGAVSESAKGGGGSDEMTPDEDVLRRAGMFEVRFGEGVGERRGWVDGKDGKE